MARAALQSARQAHERAQGAHVAAVERATAAISRVTELRTMTDGVDLPAAEACVTDLGRQRESAQLAHEAIEALSDRLDEVEALLHGAGSRLAQLETSTATVREALTGRQAAIAATRAAVAAVVGPEADPAGLPALHRRWESRLEGLEALRRGVDAWERARARHRDLAEQCEATARGRGFGSAAEARTAMLADAERARLSRCVAERGEALSRVEAVLREHEIAELAELDGAKLDEGGNDEVGNDGVAAATEACAVADREAAAAARQLHRAEQVLASLLSQQGRLDEALRLWEPAQAASDRAESLSKLVRGMGGDNHLQMRLSAYVLARRLDQVLAAANERLGQMRDQRYLLRRTGRTSRRAGQAGLDLEMLDQWTGEFRDPATLSGGETFVVSLALALGLADVVTQESGGTEIETLFVDEGFGTLDAETLDDVMDRLDGLRAGGRTVGVVSHVSELRTRIPHQLHVHKSPRGSSVRMTTFVE